MMHRQKFRQSRLAEWGCRLSIIAAHLVVFTVLLHRFADQATAVSLNLLQIGFIVGFVALVISITATVQIWNQLLSGIGKAVIGVVLSFLVLAWPLFYLPLYLFAEKNYDVSTDRERPPTFALLQKQRTFGSNDVKFTATGTFDEDVTPLRIEKPGQDVFDLARQLVLKRQWKLVSAKAPSSNKGVGVIEAVAFSPILAAPDDIVIRVESRRRQSILDVRSQARFGSFDTGRNEDRVIAFLSDILTQNTGVTRVEPGEPRFMTVKKKGKQKPPPSDDDEVPDDVGSEDVPEIIDEPESE